MNTKEAIELLQHNLGHLKIHPLFMKELSSLLKKDLKGKESHFFKILVNQLKNIEMFGILVHQTDNNEILRGLDGHFYSIHLSQSQFNVRLLIHISEDNRVYFLSAFYERGKKKATDYSQYLPVLSDRLKYMEEKYNE